MQFSPIQYRRATITDLNFLLETDLSTEGYETDQAEEPLSTQEKKEYREWLSIFVTSPVEAGWIAEDLQAGLRVGMILVRFRDRLHEPENEANRYLFRYLDSSYFPPDGRFCEIFNLWVDPGYRRRGIATHLKQLVEAETRKRGIKMIYTHTLATNQHVIELNEKLGYQILRTGPLWDQALRTSLSKWLDR